MRCMPTGKKWLTAWNGPFISALTCWAACRVGAAMTEIPNDLRDLATEVHNFLRKRFGEHGLVGKLSLEVKDPATPQNLLAEQSATILMQVNTRRIAEYTISFSVIHSP